MESAQASLKNLFQQEFSRLVAGISRQFGLQHIERAEDLVSETFLLAAETWGVRGMPANPRAWLYAVAKQKTLYQFRRHNRLVNKVMPELIGQVGEADDVAVDFSEQAIRDSQLRMLFALCTPLIPDEAQIGLALRILCGFGIDEIAQAFLTNKETITKRLFRAKEKLRTEGISLELPPERELVRRLDRVLRVIYLLFNEGYYSKTQNQTLQQDVCLEAMRLGVMLTDYTQTNLPKTKALLALMCFHASRFSARQPDNGLLILYELQDETLWDVALINQGFWWLRESLSGDEVSTYHLEARIASWHCIKDDTPDKWQAILTLYDQLIRINDSPIVALNRVYALYQVEGQAAALQAIHELRLENSHLYWMLLGELYRETEPLRATDQYRQALALAKTLPDRQQIERTLAQLR